MIRTSGHPGTTLASPVKRTERHVHALSPKPARQIRQMTLIIADRNHCRATPHHSPPRRSSRARRLPTLPPRGRHTPSPALIDSSCPAPGSSASRKRSLGLWQHRQPRRPPSDAAGVRMPDRLTAELAVRRRRRDGCVWIARVAAPLRGHAGAAVRAAAPPSSRSAASRGARSSRDSTASSSSPAACLTGSSALAARRAGAHHGDHIDEVSGQRDTAGHHEILKRGNVPHQ